MSIEKLDKPGKTITDADVRSFANHLLTLRCARDNCIGDIPPTQNHTAPSTSPKEEIAANSFAEYMLRFRRERDRKLGPVR